MITVNRHFSMFTLSINGLNSDMERLRRADQIQKQDPSICSFQKADFNITLSWDERAKKRLK